MMNGGEAADQMVSYAFKGSEVVLRLSGDAAKHLAIYLANLLKQGGPSKGKTTLRHMIADGSPLKVQRIGVNEIPYFNQMAKKYGVMFVAVKDKNQRGGTCDIMFRADDSARVNRIFDRLNISDHPDVAHIQSEIRRTRGENRQERGENRKGRGEGQPEHGEGQSERDNDRQESGKSRQPHGIGGNPTRGTENIPPSDSFSTTRDGTGTERFSVRAALRDIRNARSAGDGQNSAPEIHIPDYFNPRPSDKGR